MQKVLLIGVFSLMTLPPFRCAFAQAGSNAPAVRVVEQSSGGSTGGARKTHDPASEAAARSVSGTNQTASSSLIERTAIISNVNSKESEAQRFYNAGVALHDSGKVAEAIGAFKEANRLKPNDAQTQYMLGMAYWKGKAYNDAVDAFKLAVRFKPDWAEAYFRLGLTYYVLGRKTQVTEAHKKLLELNSPLANKLYQISDNANPGRIDDNLKVKTVASSAKQIDLVPVSTSTNTARLNEKPKTPANRLESSSTTFASAPKTIPSVVPPDDKPSGAVSESINARTTAVSSASATLTSTAPVRRTSDAAPAFTPASINEATASDDGPLTEIYKVGVGDVLDIRLLNSPANRSTLYSVIEGGLIDFPIAGGPLAVAGMTTKDIQTRIASELKRLAVEDRPQVAVGVRQYASHTVIINGLVSSPGTKTLRREAVPLYVLLAEVQPRTDAGRAAITRAGMPTQVVDLSDTAALNLNVRSGDVINLTARPLDFYYIGGRMSHPGQKSFQPGITLVQAILAAGGVAHGNMVEVSREGSDGRLATTKFNLKEIKSGKIQDPKLQPGDRVEVLR